MGKTKVAETSEKMEKIVSLCKRRGFIFPSSEIYGGLGSTWDYGPMGVLLKNNVKAAWWRENVQYRKDMSGLDAAILMHPNVWKASGHVDCFQDPMVDCKSCRKRFRADDLEGDRCPECDGEFTEARQFNLMFKTFMGPVEEDTAVVYLRPETAQGIFVNFRNVANVTRKKLPFGIAQIGKAFRNEITPGKFTFRTREFEQMEIEFFCHPSEGTKWYEYWYKERFNWYIKWGIRKENLRLRPHDKDELAHYAEGCQDVEYNFPWGWSELEGIANRTDFDLRRHQESSNENLTYFDEEKNEHILPCIIEPSAGADRGTLAFLVDAYDEDEAPTEKGEMDKRIVLRFHRAIAPVKAAVLPLSRKPQLQEVADRLYSDLRCEFFCDYDDRGSIGKRYRRQDEIGTPYSITVDFQTLEDQAVTVRDRDTMKQDRISLAALIDYLKEKMKV
ncbi:MAG: glycine--tRNA ligase [Candidatus Xenobiia bacterium LiM19]